MQAIYKNLLEKSIAASLSAIEIYNKPDFKYRDEVFVILTINSWELLLKAKILKDEKKISSLFVYNGRFIKRNRTGNPFTIDILGAINKLELNSILEENLKKLVEIRDTAIHFYNNESTSYLIYSLGAASLRNYNKLANEWFGIDLSSKYNLNILPLGFAYNFKTFSTIDLKKEPEIIKNIILDISKRQKDNKIEKDGFFLVCEIRAELVTAKKIADDSAIRVVIDKNAKDAQVAIIKKEKITDLYPYTWTDLRDKLKKDHPNFKQNLLSTLISKHKIKGNEKYSAYNFRSKRQENEFRNKGKLPSTTPVIYNNDCFLFLKSEIEKEIKKKSI